MGVRFPASTPWGRREQKEHRMSEDVQFVRELPDWGHGSACLVNRIETEDGSVLTIDCHPELIA